MKTIVKLKYKCRWCEESFESKSESLDGIILEDRKHETHYCNKKGHDKYPDVCPLRVGFGDLVGYTVIRTETDP